MAATRRALLIVVFGAAGLMIVGSGLAWACTVQASISLAPTSGPPGSTTTVEGKDFVLGEVEIYWDEVSSDSLLATVEAEPPDSESEPGAGEFSAEVTIPSDASAGAHSLVALSSPDANGNRYQAAAPFEVVVPAVSVDATEQAGEPDDDGVFTFTRSGDASVRLTAAYALSGSAAAGVDYQELPGEVTFPAESSTVSQPVEVVDDDEVEDDETVGVSLQAGDGYVVGEPASATVTIADDDAADSEDGGGTEGGGDGTDTDQDGTAPTSLTLTPQEATNSVGQQHAVTATVADADGNAVSAVSVEFAVAGAHAASVSVGTDASGQASFSYTGQNAGDDAITAFADTDGDGSQDDGEPADTAAKTWEAVEDGEEEADVAAAAAQVAGGEGPVAACAEEFVPTAGFGDVSGGVHESAIDCVAWYAIALGLGDVDGDGQSDYAPEQAVNRAQMASFLGRLADEAGLVAPDAADAFGDDDGSVHEDSMNVLAALGISEGKGDLDGDGVDDYAPREPVTRAQMASFLARLADQAGLDVPDDVPDVFGDDDGSVHEGSINVLAALGISEGKGDLDGDGVDDYAPREPVNRAQMASFLVRELELLVDADLAEPGGADVDLADESTESGELSGTVVANKPVADVVADGCGLVDQALDVAGDGSFTLTIPDDQPAGDCELTVTVTTQRPGADTRGQTVSYIFHVTMSG